MFKPTNMIQWFFRWVGQLFFREKSQFSTGKRPSCSSLSPLAYLSPLMQLNASVGTGFLKSLKLLKRMSRNKYNTVRSKVVGSIPATPSFFCIFSGVYTVQGSNLGCWDRNNMTSLFFLMSLFTGKVWKAVCFFHFPYFYKFEFLWSYSSNLGTFASVVCLNQYASWMNEWILL